MIRFQRKPHKKDETKKHVVNIETVLEFFVIGLVFLSLISGSVTVISFVSAIGPLNVFITMLH